MRKYGKWALVLGLMAATPGLSFAAPWSRAENGDKASSQAPAGKTQNQKVADDIAVALRNARLQGYDIEIEYKNGTATLKGRVTDPKQKDKATQVLQKLPGVEKVDNQLVLTTKPSVSERMTVQQPGGGGVQQASHSSAGPRADRVKQVSYEPVPPGPATAPASGNQAMAEQIAAALTAANLDGYDIEIRFQNGVAILGGSVGTSAQRMSAEQVVQQVPGVQGVQNQLRTTQEAPRGPMPGPQGPYGGPQGPYGGPQAQYGGPQGPQGPMMGPNGPVHPAAFQGGMPPGGPGMMGAGAMGQGGPVQPTGGYAHGGYGSNPAIYNGPSVPDYAWPSYAQYPNSAAVTYPQQYSASAFPYIGPFYPYPQVPLGWRDATLRWDDGQWNLQFKQRTDKWWWFLSPKNW